MENFDNTQRFGNHILGSMLNAREKLTSGIKELSFGGKKQKFEVIRQFVATSLRMFRIYFNALL